MVEGFHRDDLDVDLRLVEERLISTEFSDIEFFDRADAEVSSSNLTDGCSSRTETGTMVSSGRSLSRS